MKRIGASKLLGVAMGQQSLLIAEVTARGETRKVSRTAEFVYPEGLSLDKPVELGQALAAFLRKKGFSTHDAVFGLPTKWLLTRRKDLPPATPAVASGTLRLFAESEFSTEFDDLTIDFAGQTSPSSPSSVMVVATHKSYLQRCQELAKAAKLKCRAITLTGAALGWLASAESSQAELVLCISPIGDELIVQRMGIPSQLRHIAVSSGQEQEPAQLLGELRRTLATLPAEVKRDSLTIWGSSEVRNGLADALRAKLGLGTVAATMKSVQGNGQEPTHEFAPAIAVALIALAGISSAADFVHSRLAPPKPKSSRRPMAWGIAVAAAACIAATVALVDLSQKRSDLASLETRLQDMGPSVDKASVEANRLQTANLWMSGKPRFIATFSELTKLFPDEGSIWATALNLHQDLTGQLSGKAASEQQVWALLDRMTSSKKFLDPQARLDMRDGSRGAGREVAFTITFAFRAPE